MMPRRAALSMLLYLGRMQYLSLAQQESWAAKLYSKWVAMPPLALCAFASMICCWIELIVGSLSLLPGYIPELQPPQTCLEDLASGVGASSLKWQSEM